MSTTLPARQRGALGLPTLKVVGIDQHDCLVYMDVHDLEIVFPPYSVEHTTVHTELAAKGAAS